MMKFSSRISTLFVPSILLLGVSTPGLVQNTPGYNNKIPDNIPGSTSLGDPEKSSW